ILALYQGHRDGSNINVEYYHDGAANPNNEIRLSLPLNTSARKRTAAEFLASFTNITDASRTSQLQIHTAANGSFGPALTLLGNLLGLNTITTPQGTLHAHDGTGGMLFATKTGIAGSAQTIIPNGAGDVTLGFIGLHITAAGTTASAGTLGPLGPNQTQNVVIGANTYQYAVAANGALTVQLTAGSTAGQSALLLLWL